ncbi:MAG: hypothetical protein JWP81_4484 [Ferruginibacter sp.]|nr:hypothetical protein [Ferruginibacter sp.]
MYLLKGRQVLQASAQIHAETRLGNSKIEKVRSGEQQHPEFTGESLLQALCRAGLTVLRSD